MASNQEFGLDVGIYGPLARPEIVLDLAQLAEEMEFGAVWLADHVAFPVEFDSKYPYSETGVFPTKLDQPLLEAIATMGVLAGATKRVKLGTAVLVMPHRNPLLLARMLATIDQFSGGRVILGAGTGWLREEFEALDTFDFARRGKVTDEYIEIFKAVCTGGDVGYEGETYSFKPVVSAPGSVQRPHPRILIGGVADPALRRVARLGDGWLAVSLEVDSVAERLERLRGLCADQGRRYEDLQLAYKIFLSIGEAKRGMNGAREPGTGSLAQIVDDLKRLKDMGFGHFIVRYRSDGEAEQRAQIARFADDVIPRL